jgi:hypothetical protein
MAGKATAGDASSGSSSNSRVARRLQEASDAGGAQDRGQLFLAARQGNTLDAEVRCKVWSSESGGNKRPRSCLTL